MRFALARNASAMAALVGAAFSGGAAVVVPHEVRGLLRRISGPEIKPDHTRVRGSYMPHQGKRECARRVRQMAKAAERAARFA